MQKFASLLPRFRSWVGVQWMCLLLLGLGAGGCQTAGPTVSNRTLLAHLPGVDFSGLAPMASVESVKVSCSLPDKWVQLKLEAQRAVHPPAMEVSVGIYRRGRFDGSPALAAQRANSALVCKTGVFKRESWRGKAVGEWTDALGRPWFEAENEQYHVRGYAVVDGFTAWIVYFGYKVNRPPNPGELNVANRCLQTVVPQSSEKTPPSDAGVADGEKTDVEKKG